MTKETIAVDIDEVLFPMTELFLEYHNEMHGTNFNVSDMKSYYVEELTGETEEEMLAKIEVFVGTDAYKRSGPMHEAIDAITGLNRRYDLVLVTARDPFYRGSTEEFIEKHFPGMFRELYYTHTLDQPETRTPKYVLCQQVGAIALIDDSLKNATQCAEHGMPSVVFGDYPWNQAEALPVGVTRCKDWLEVVRYFNERAS